MTVRRKTLLTCAAGAVLWLFSMYILFGEKTDPLIGSLVAWLGLILTAIFVVTDGIALWLAWKHPEQKYAIGWASAFPAVLGTVALLLIIALIVR